MSHRCVCTLLVLLVLSFFGAGLRSDPPPAGEWGFAPAEPLLHALRSITGQSLEGRLSFLAADVLGGRPTPSTGQDIAAEYMAAEFRRSGLKPIGTKDYFQAVPMTESRPDRESFLCRIHIGGRTVDIPPGRFDMSAVASVEIDRAPVVVLPLETGALEGVPGLDGKVLMAVARPEAGPAEDVRPRQSEFGRRAFELRPRLLVFVLRGSAEDAGYFDRPQLRLQADGAQPGGARRSPVVTISDPSLAELLDAAAPEGLPTKLSLRIGERPSDQRLLRNVAGLLPGASPGLRDSYVLLTAHYDGTGSYQGDSQDRIWNAANDNASGAAAVIEIAAALSTLAEKPRRSILFVCFFGEEKGMLGSRHYANNPLVPIDRTVAAINLEQLGRTDATEGDQTGRANVTGYDYSEVGEILRLAGEHTGIRVSKSEKFSDFYFVASDNIVLARLGVPSHTFSVSYHFPDYHGAGDEWQKFDFANMEKVVRTAALAVLFMAQNDRVPQWDAANPRAERFAGARASQGQPGGNKD